MEGIYEVDLTSEITIDNNIFRTETATAEDPIADNRTNSKDITIINLSKRNLTFDEKSILNKGLKFTPVPSKNNPNELKSDIHEFTRKLRLVEYFEGVEDTDISLR